MQPSILLNIDSFRFISSLNTTVRQLFICSEIVRKVGVRHIPEKIVSSSLAKWSFDLELKNEEYRLSRGKLTNNSKLTHALKHYFSLCSSLGLLININGVFSCTNYSRILLYFLPDLNRREISLSNEEKVFFMFQLLKLDADGLLFIFDILENEPYGISQKNLQICFKPTFNKRLIAKESVAVGYTKTKISEKFRLINYVWKEPVKYSEHFLIPRCEWLKDLGLVNINKVKSSTIYSLSDKGFSLLNYFPKVNDSGIRDIDNRWLNKKLFSFISNIIYTSGFKIERFIERNDKIELLINSLVVAKTKIGLGSSFKMPLYETLIFISFDHLLNKLIITEFDDLIELLRSGLDFQGFNYSIKEEARINEGYISIRAYQ